MIKFAVSDYILIVIYFIAAVLIGFRTGKKDDTEENYLVMGRRLTLPAFVATLVSSFYGGILGVGEFTYRYGISSWFLNAFPYYVFIVIFALFFARRIRKTQLFTIPDKLEITYGKKVGVFGAAMIFLLVTPAPYLFMLGLITSMIFGFPMWISMVICLLFSVMYLYKGGLNADVRVNVFEFILMFLGFGIIIPFCFLKLGDFSFLQNNLPEQHLTFSGGHSAAYILVWFFIGAWAIVDPGFHQRCYAAKNEKTARNGVFISLIFWFIFDAMTTITGLFAVASLKDIKDPAMSYPLLAESILPKFAKGFFFIGLIATIMSTLHSYMFISASTLGKDIINRLKNSRDSSNKFSKIGIITASVLSLVIALLVPSVVEIWYIIGSITIPSLLIAVVSSYFPVLNINKTWLLSAMIVSFLFSFFWVILKVSFIEPMYPGLVGGLIVYSVGFLYKRINI
ncbi:MAG: sodium:solute symporter family protein [Ignavibacteria bacterium]|nr:sodium:solute symporter family protein [Ignavibacteria bacterium]